MRTSLLALALLSGCAQHTAPPSAPPVRVEHRAWHPRHRVDERARAGDDLESRKDRLDTVMGQLRDLRRQVMILKEKVTGQ
ncbi:MAG: hypothetical protein KGO96_10560 [Elusimicrobia bacterium]|nr:hypothetical protein [Elusimicrobiota bacterium]